MSVKKIAQVANRFIAHLEDGEIRKATENEVNLHLASLAPGEKNGGVLEAVRLNQETGNAEYLYAHTSEKGKVSHKKYAKKVLAQNSQSQSQTEPVDGVQDEKKVKEEKLDVPTDESKRKPEGKWDRPKSVDSPTKVREEKYQRGDGGEDLHTDVVPRSKNNSGLEGSESTSFADEKGDDATSGNENSYVQNWDKSESPTPAGNEMNHAVADKEGEVKTASDGPLDVAFTTDLMGMVSKSDQLDTNATSGKEDGNETKLPNASGEDKIADSIEATNKETIAKSEGKVTKEAFVDEDVVKETQEAKSQLKEASTLLTKAKAEINKYKIRESRMHKAIEYALNLQGINPEKYANVNTFISRVADTVKKMDVEAIDVAIEETRAAASEIREASHRVNEAAKEATAATGTEGLQTALVVPRIDEGFDESKKKDALAQILMDSTRLGKQMVEFENYTPHEKTW